jgi:hypothetical protein
MSAEAFIDNLQTPETAQMLVNWQMDRQTDTSTQWNVTL